MTPNQTTLTELLYNLAARATQIADASKAHKPPHTCPGCALLKDSIEQALYAPAHPFLIPLALLKAHDTIPGAKQHTTGGTQP